MLKRDAHDTLRTLGIETGIGIVLPEDADMEKWTNDVVEVMPDDDVEGRAIFQLLQIGFHPGRAEGRISPLTVAIVEQQPTTVFPYIPGRENAERN